MTKRLPFVRCIAVFLTGILLFQTTVADAATTLWQERRQKRSARTQLAALSLPAAAPLSASLGALATTPPSDAPPSLLTSVRLALPATAGRIETTAASTKPGPVVVVIHDVHHNEE